MCQCVCSFSSFSRAGLWLLSAYGAAMFLLSSYAAAPLISLLHESSLAALIASKVIFEHVNCRSCFMSSLHMIRWTDFVSRVSRLELIT